jgi:hypothetical protein
MDKTVIADLGVEGGGITIYGRQTDGVWSFWTEGTSMDLDENDEGVWRSSSSEPVDELDLVVPVDWLMFRPVTIHPEFVEWFRAVYEESRLTLLEVQRRYHEKYRHRHWTKVLGLK